MRVNEPSRLEQLWARGGFAITLQFPPLLTTRAEQLVEQIATWMTDFDAVLTGDASDGAVALSGLAVAVFFQRAGIETIVQVSGRDRNRLALQSDILSVSTLGISNLLVDTRLVERAHLSQTPDARLVIDLHGPALLSTAARLRDAGRLTSGVRIKHPPMFYLGALVPFEDQWSVEDLDAAQFLVTTPFHDAHRQMDRFASFCTMYADFLKTRPLLVSLPLRGDLQSEDALQSAAHIEAIAQDVLAEIEALKLCERVRGCNIVVERLADLLLVEQIALTARASSKLSNIFE